MHKKISAELVSLANSILQMKDKDDVSALHKKAQGICEKLSVLKFVDSYINSTPEAIESAPENIAETQKSLSIETEKEKLLVNEVIENVVDEVEETEALIVEEIIEDVVEETKETLSEAAVEAFFSTEEELEKEDEKELPPVQFSLEEEFKDAISSDVATQLFEKATKENPIILENTEVKKRSLNDSLFSNNLQIGLNDRIAFVKHLFDGSQEDFNRVLSQLNSFKKEQEALDFIQNFVKLDYDWSTKLEYEQRLINLIERKFL